MTLEDQFIAGLLGRRVERHRIAHPRGRTFTLCGDGGWCTEDPDEVTCLDCKAIQEERAEPLPQEWMP